MRKMKRFLALLLSVTILLSSESISVFATEESGVTDVVETTELVTEPVTQPETQELAIPMTGYIALPREDETSEVRYDLFDGGEFPQLFADNLPSAYQTSNLPAVRNQNSYGTCWTFSTLGLAEIGLLQQKAKAVDLSELHLAYFTYYSVPCKLPR
ncbi:MAG: hypothetical protein IIX89_04400 [Oscillospiraceae bacterium]|nr:hypothetical protein [Oscillospiraceae bacterium]